jgi:holo-[acyl-carrier protein] synthase
VLVGLDLIEIERVAAALDRHPSRFRERVFTPREIAECDRKPRPAESYAGRFAAKEAIGKALGVGVQFTWREIEIAGRGKPQVELSGRTRRVADHLGVVRIDLSMTHSRTTAAAVALAVTADPSAPVPTLPPRPPRG